MATGMVQLGLLFVDAVGQEEKFHYAAALAKFSAKTDVMVNLQISIICIYKFKRIWLIVVPKRRIKK